ncbi:MAG TPA: flavin reductase family protein [Ignavibacteriaceae bacterium]|nr:flavin reductase family protein [Ignavibacteriaceae bacterium]
MFHYEPKELSVPEVHKLLLGGVAPRPIALASTVSKDGINNLSPFSFFNAFGANPPVVAFSPSRRGTNASLKDTYNNLMEINECVIQAVTHSMIEQVSLASAEYPPDVDEFVKSGLTPIDSDLVRPKRVKESPFQMECKLLEMKSFGQGNASANLAICEVLMFHVSEDIFTDEVIDPSKIDLVARMSANYYARASAGVFIVEKPIGKKCIGYDQIPLHIRQSEAYSANDLGKFGNSESIPSDEEIGSFIKNIKENKLNQFKHGYGAFLRYQRLGDHRKMLKAALMNKENQKNNIELAAKCALKNNDIDFAWRVAIFAGNY